MKNKFNIDLYHKKFRNFVVKDFSFLVEKFNFKIIKEGKEPYAYSYRITYKNKTTAINVSYDIRDEGISVLIYRLVDGEIPTYPIFVTKDTMVNCYYFDTIIALRSSNPDEDLYTKEHVKEFPPIYDEKTIEKIVSEYAKAVRKYGKDIMTGDFRVFNELENELKKNNKNVMTYNITHSKYDKERKKEIMKDHKSKFGKEVKCIVRFYNTK